MLRCAPARRSLVLDTHLSYHGGVSPLMLDIMLHTHLIVSQAYQAWLIMVHTHLFFMSLLHRLAAYQAPSI